MLDRVAMHQTRLRTPGLGLDGRGVALGAKGVVLLPSLDRLVAFIALHSAHATLGDIVPSLRIAVVRSKLGHREVILSFAADSTDRMDTLAEAARLAGGYVFTGTSRHFVQYRDAGAPFGYDLQSIAPTDATYCLAHTTFSQDYTEERTIELRRLLLGLEPRLEPAAGRGTGPRWICTESGLGPALLQYFVRSQVAGEVGVVEWPPASGFDDSPERRYVFRLDVLPERMVGLLGSTPGIGVFEPAGPGAAVEIGHRHPVELRACPVFDERGLVLFRGHGQGPLEIAKLPRLGALSAFARVSMNDTTTGSPRVGQPSAAPAVIELPLRLVPDTEPFAQVKATFVPTAQLGLLRTLAYRLGRSVIESTLAAFTPLGVFLLREGGIEAIPVGDYFRQIHPNIYVAAGYVPVPPVAPEVLHRALGSPEADVVFIHGNGQRVGIDRGGFAPLSNALLGRETWSGVAAEDLRVELETPLPVVELEDPGYNPLRDVQTPREPEGSAP